MMLRNHTPSDDNRGPLLSLIVSTSGGDMANAQLAEEKFLLLEEKITAFKNEHSKKNPNSLLDKIRQVVSVPLPSHIENDTPITASQIDLVKEKMCLLKQETEQDQKDQDSAPTRAFSATKWGQSSWVGMAMMILGLAIPASAHGYGHGQPTHKNETHHYHYHDDHGTDTNYMAGAMYHFISLAATMLGGLLGVPFNNSPSEMVGGAMMIACVTVQIVTLSELYPTSISLFKKYLNDAQYSSEDAHMFAHWIFSACFLFGAVFISTIPMVKGPLGSLWKSLKSLGTKTEEPEETEAAIPQALSDEEPSSESVAIPMEKSIDEMTREELMIKIEEKVYFRPIKVLFYRLPLSNTPDNVLRELLKAREEFVNETDQLKAMGFMATLSVCLHGFFEGIIGTKAAMHSATPNTQLALALALHSMADGICVFIPVFQAHRSYMKALVAVLIGSLGKLVGGVLYMSLSGVPSIQDLFQHGLFGGVLESTTAGILFILATHIFMQANKYDRINVWTSPMSVFALLLTTVTFSLFPP